MCLQHDPDALIVLHTCSLLIIFFMPVSLSAGLPAGTPLSLQMGTIPAEVSLSWRFAAAALLTFGIARGVGVALHYGRVDHLRFACFALCCFQTILHFFTMPASTVPRVFWR